MYHQVQRTKTFHPSILVELLTKQLRYSRTIQHDKRNDLKLLYTSPPRHGHRVTHRMAKQLLIEFRTECDNQSTNHVHRAAPKLAPCAIHAGHAQHTTQHLTSAELQSVATNFWPTTPPFPQLPNTRNPPVSTKHQGAQSISMYYSMILQHYNNTCTTIL